MKRMTTATTLMTVFALIICSCVFAEEAKLMNQGKLLSPVGKLRIEMSRMGIVEKITITSEVVPNNAVFYLPPGTGGQLVAIVNGKQIVCPIFSKREKNRILLEGQLYELANPPGTFAVAQLLFESREAQANLDYHLRVHQGTRLLGLNNHTIDPAKAKFFAQLKGQSYVGDLRDIGTNIELGKKIPEGECCIVSVLSKTTNLTQSE